MFFFSLRCHPLVNRKDGSRLLRFFPRAFGPGRTFFPGHRSGSGRVSRRNYRRNHPPNAFPRTGFAASSVFLNETRSSPGRTRYPSHLPTRGRRVPCETHRSRGRFVQENVPAVRLRLTYARGNETGNVNKRRDALRSTRECPADRIREFTMIVRLGDYCYYYF